MITGVVEGGDPAVQSEIEDWCKQLRSEEDSVIPILHRLEDHIRVYESTVHS